VTLKKRCAYNEKVQRTQMIQEIGFIDDVEWLGSFTILGVVGTVEDQRGI
jgi:hypothetical protein